MTDGSEEKKRLESGGRREEEGISFLEQDICALSTKAL